MAKRASEKTQAASDVLSACRSVSVVVDATVSLMKSGFDRSEVCLLAAESVAADKLGVDRFECAPEESPNAGHTAGKMVDLFGPLILVEPDQAPPGEALVISLGGICSRLQAHALISGGRADLVTVLGYCLAGEYLNWAESKLMDENLLLGVHAPSGKSQLRAIDLLWAAGAEDVRVVEYFLRDTEKKARA